MAAALPISVDFRERTATEREIDVITEENKSDSPEFPEYSTAEVFYFLLLNVVRTHSHHSAARNCLITLTLMH